ncbi:MAG: aldehyde ferredoxin oxidoreductase family protein [Thermoproteota archaeon]
MFGWMGYVVDVNLSRGSVVWKDLEEDVAKKFVGGRGYGVKVLFDELEKGINPLDERNILIFSTGPLTGSSAPTSGRYSVVTKSPLTGTIFDSNSGGFFGPRLKACGLDALILRGCSKSPVYLHIKDQDLEILGAEDLWGKDTHETRSILLSRHGKDSRVACIGPAGENLVKIAAIMNDDDRAAARGGVGGVMGSKMLKAIVASGTAKTKISDPESFSFIVRECSKLLEQNPVTSKALPRFGTAVLTNLMNELNILPTRNFLDPSFSKANEISGESIREKILIRQRACFNCSIACGRVTKTKNQQGEGPEYETVYALGSNCLVGDLEDVTEANYLCNKLGIDTISMGGTIATAMELHERGLLQEEIHWGDGRIVKNLIELTAQRKGIGDMLAEGSKILAERYGFPDSAIHVKGLELPGYDPRGTKGMGLAYATSNRGACHLRSYMVGIEVLGFPKRIDRFSSVNKAGLCIVQQNLNSAMDTLVLCRFTSYALDEDHYARLLTKATGVQYTPEDFLLLGERIWNLERLFNLREGFGRKDDTLPRRFIEEPLREGSTKGQVVELEKMLDEYYRFRGWDKDGRPTPRKIAQLGIG